MNDAFSIAVVIPNYNGASVLPGCLRALTAQTLTPSELIVVDDASTDGSNGAVASIAPHARVIRLPRNGGFARAANAGVRLATTRTVAVLNSDARPAPDWLALLSGFRRPGLFSCGGVLLDRSGRIESAADCWFPAGHTAKWLHGESVDSLPPSPYEVFAPPGAAPVFDRGRFLELGGYDERFGLYLEDIDLAFRAHARRWTSWVVPAARIQHDLGASSRPEVAQRYIARNSLRCHVLNSPSFAPRELLRTTVREARAARSRGLGRAYAQGRFRGLLEVPSLMSERARRHSDLAVDSTYPRGTGVATQRDG